jgi:hypothetical protein
VLRKRWIRVVDAGHEEPDRAQSTNATPAMQQTIQITVKELMGSRLESDFGARLIGHDPPNIKKDGPGL